MASAFYSCLHNGDFPKRCGIPTAAGKTNSIARRSYPVWLIALWRDNDDPKREHELLFHDGWSVLLAEWLLPVVGLKVTYLFTCGKYQSA